MSNPFLNCLNDIAGHALDAEGRLDQLRAVLRPAVEAARIRAQEIEALGLTTRIQLITEETDKALLAAGEILGLTEQSAEESEAG